jgi:hypothetical protein
MTRPDAAETSSRNIDELKRLVISALDRNGVLSELRSTIKVHVARAINEDPNGTVVHQRNARIGALLNTDRGQLLTELIVEFLRFYDLKDTLAMFLVEGRLSKLRPSEAELASQCGVSLSHTSGLSVIEQYLLQHSSHVRYEAHHELSSNVFDTHVPDGDSSPLPTREDVEVDHESPLFRGNAPENVSPTVAARDLLSNLEEHSTSPLGVNTSLENDMARMRNISQEIERISLSSLAPGMATFDSDSPRYDGDKFESDEENDASPEYRTTKRTSSNPRNEDDPDAVLFESRESPLRDLGEAPGNLFPIDRNDFVEKAML